MTGRDRPVAGSGPDRVGRVFSALSDPTRRTVLDHLAHAESSTASELSETIPVSRQAIVKHLQALAGAGLATPTREGREIRYAFTPAPLEDVARWIADRGAAWDGRLERLRDLLDDGAAG